MRSASRVVLSRLKCASLLERSWNIKQLCRGLRTGSPALKNNGVCTPFWGPPPPPGRCARSQVSDGHAALMITASPSQVSMRNYECGYRYLYSELSVQRTRRAKQRSTIDRGREEITPPRRGRAVPGPPSSRGRDYKPEVETPTGYTFVLCVQGLVASIWGAIDRISSASGPSPFSLECRSPSRRR